jgi:hypothetical protein
MSSADSERELLSPPLVPTVVLNWTPSELYEPDPAIEQQRDAINRLELAAAVGPSNDVPSAVVESTQDELPGIDADQMPPR